MYSKPTQTLGELAERHSDLIAHDLGGPAECLVRTGELLVPADRLDPAVRILERWIDTVETDGPPVLRLRAGAAADCARIAQDFADRVPVAPNHVHLVGAPVLHGTGAVPVPADPPPPPPPGVWWPPVTAALFDTGLDAHPWFAERPWFRPSALEVLDADDDGIADRLAGHGTFVAGVLLQHAPGLTLRAHRVLDPRGTTDDRTLAAALHREARLPHPDLVVLTAGCHTVDDRCPPVVAEALAAFTATEVFAAAGNTGTDRPFWPAALPTVTAVGASDDTGARAAFSNHGPWVDRLAPGVDVVSSHTRLRGGLHEHGAARWSGTSFAAPRAAAEIACTIAGLDHTFA